MKEVLQDQLLEMQSQLELADRVNGKAVCKLALIYEIVKNCTADDDHVNKIIAILEDDTDYPPLS